MNGYSEIYVCLNGGSAICAFIAAALWFQASIKPKIPVDSWGVLGGEQIRQALEPGLRWNRRAAAFSGVAALLLAIATALPMLLGCL